MNRFDSILCQRISPPWRQILGFPTRIFCISGTIHNKLLLIISDIIKFRILLIRWRLRPPPSQTAVCHRAGNVWNLYAEGQNAFPRKFRAVILFHVSKEPCCLLQAMQICGKRWPFFFKKRFYLHEPARASNDCRYGDLEIAKYWAANIYGGHVSRQMSSVGYSAENNFCLDWEMFLFPRDRFKPGSRRTLCRMHFTVVKLPFRHLLSGVIAYHCINRPSVEKSEV